MEFFFFRVLFLLRPFPYPRPRRRPAPAGPRLKISAVDARILGAAPGPSGWHDVPSSGLLLRVRGGSGPPVHLRIRPRATHFEAAVDARPWGNVRLDGRDMGTTPAATVPLRPGQRRLEVIGPDGAITTVRLQVSP